MFTTPAFVVVVIISLLFEVNLIIKKSTILNMSPYKGWCRGISVEKIKNIFVRDNPYTKLRPKCPGNRGCLSFILGHHNMTARKYTPAQTNCFKIYL